MSCSVNGIKAAIQKYTPSVLMVDDYKNANALILGLSKDVVHSVLKDRNIDDAVKQHIREVLQADDNIPLIESNSLALKCTDSRCTDGLIHFGDRLPSPCPFCWGNKMSEYKLKRQLALQLEDNGDGEGSTYSAKIVYELHPKAKDTKLSKNRIYDPYKVQYKKKLDNFDVSWHYPNNSPVYINMSRNAYKDYFTKKVTRNWMVVISDKTGYPRMECTFNNEDFWACASLYNALNDFKELDEQKLKDLGFKVC